MLHVFIFKSKVKSYFSSKSNEQYVFIILFHWKVNQLQIEMTTLSLYFKKKIKERLICKRMPNAALLNKTFVQILLFFPLLFTYELIYFFNVLILFSKSSQMLGISHLLDFLMKIILHFYLSSIYILLFLLLTFDNKKKQMPY